jgi:hypothetical protein
MATHILKSINRQKKVRNMKKRRPRLDHAGSPRRAALRTNHCEPTSRDKRIRRNEPSRNLFCIPRLIEMHVLVKIWSGFRVEALGLRVEG